MVFVAAAAVVYVGYLFGTSDNRAEFWTALRAFLGEFQGEPQSLRAREHSPHVEVRRAAGVCRHCDDAGKTDAKVPPYEAARLEGDEKHESPPLELRERLTN